MFSLICHFRVKEQRAFWRAEVEHNPWVYISCGDLICVCISWGSSSCTAGHFTAFKELSSQPWCHWGRSCVSCCAGKEKHTSDVPKGSWQGNECPTLNCCTWSRVFCFKWYSLWNSLQNTVQNLPGSGFQVKALENVSSCHTLKCSQARNGKEKGHSSTGKLFSA